MKKISIAGLLASLLLVGHVEAYGKVIFGSKDSSIVITDDSCFKVVPTFVTIEGGNFENTGYARVEGNPIKFDQGIYTYFNSRINLEGVVDGDTIQLGENSPQGFGVMIANPGGLAGAKISALKGQSIMRGQPLFFGPNDITLADLAVFQLAVQNAVNTDITLNNGILRLQDDLLLGDSAAINGDGYVLLNNRRISFGGQSGTWTGNLVWYSALDIQLNSPIVLAANWLFADQGQINGNGNVLDLTGGGQILVDDNSVLRLASVQIKGLGNGEGFGKIRLGQGARLYLSDVVIEMGDDYDVISGEWYVEGSSKVITKDHVLSFKEDPEDAAKNGKLIVDRVDLTYDTLATLDKINIRPSLINDPLRRFVQIIGSGDIRTIKGDTVTFHNYRADSLLQKYAIVAPYRKFFVYPELLDDLTTQNFDVLIDGNTNFLGFTRCDEPVFIVSADVQATTQNMVMRDLSPRHIALEAGASLTFGDKTMVTLARNEVLNYPWVFSGDTILRGAGMVLELGPEGAIIVTGSNSTLLLDGVILKGVHGNNIRCTENTSNISLRGVKWIQSDDFTYAAGSMTLVDDATIVGPSRFIYASNRPFAILADATLFLTRDLTFDWRGAKNGLQFVDAAGTGAIQLDQVTVAAPNGLVIDTPGRLIVRNTNYKEGIVDFDVLTPDYSGSFD